MIATLAHVARESATLALELALILTEAACECFLEARRPAATSVTVLDWRDAA